MATKKSRHLAAQAWCEDTTKHLTMIPALAEAFANILDGQSHDVSVGLKALSRAENPRSSKRVKKEKK